MKAAILESANTPLKIAEVAFAPLTCGQVLVHVLSSGICGAQIQEISGEKGNHFPRLMGHDGCGIVKSVGPGVTRVKTGDKVVMHWRRAAGIESEMTRFQYHGAIVQVPHDEHLSAFGSSAGQVTTFCEESVASENRLTPVPHDTPDDLCALLGCGLSTALMTIEHEANLMMGEKVLIIGCGGLGANLILAAKLRQASYIVSVDSHAKGSLATSLGAHLFTDRPVADLAPRTFDAIIDTTGNFAAVRDAFDLLASGGRFIMVGQPKPGASVEIPYARSLFDGEGKRIIATQGGGFRPDRDIPRYVAMHRAGLLKLDGLVTHRFKLEDINDGIELVRNGQAGRVMVHMG